jgi:hypothetical protein
MKSTVYRLQEVATKPDTGMRICHEPAAPDRAESNVAHRKAEMLTSEGESMSVPTSREAAC